MHTQERKLPAISKGGELPAQRSYSIRLVKAIGEESDAKGRYQQVASKAKLASKLVSTPVFRLRLQAVTRKSGTSSSNPLRAGNSPDRTTPTPGAPASQIPQAVYHLN